MKSDRSDLADNSNVVGTSVVVTLPKRAFYHKAQEASCKAWVIGGTMLTGQTLANPAPGTTMQHPPSRVGDGTGCVTLAAH